MHRFRRKILLDIVVFLVGVSLGVSLVLAIEGPQGQYPQPTPTPIVQHTPQSTPPACLGPTIPFGKLPPGTRYSTVADHVHQPSIVWHNIRYVKVPGKEGRLWGDYRQEGKMKEVLLYAPKSQYCPL